MTTRIPLTIHGNLTKDPKTGVDDNSKAWTQLRVAVQDRRWNKDAQVWEDGDPVVHDVAVFGRQAEYVAKSRKKNQTVLVEGELQFHRLGVARRHPLRGRRGTALELRVGSSLGPRCRRAVSPPPPPPLTYTFDSEGDLFVAQAINESDALELPTVWDRVLADPAELRRHLTEAF